MAWNFNRVSKKFWSDSDNVNNFVKNLTSKLNIQKMEDWYNVSVEQMHEHGAAGLISRLSLYHLLMRLYPGITKSFLKCDLIKCVQNILGIIHGFMLEKKLQQDFKMFCVNSFQEESLLHQHDIHCK